MKSCIIVLSGLPGSGKSEAASYLAKQQIPVIRMGKVTDKLLRNEKSIGETKEREVRENLRQKFGQDIYAKLIIPEIKSKFIKNNIIVVDGLRNLEESQCFQDHFPCIKTIYIQVNKRIRYKRLKERPVRSLTEKQAAQRDNAELYSLGLINIKQNADYIIDNNGSIDSLQMQMDKILYLLGISL